uniref:Cell wall protein AWA1-like n=1 Tax=Hirondellea gigas TaxID=1518452 RepID=A0A2P2I0A2_9CRUS
MLSIPVVRTFEEADIDSTNNLDGSYSFSYVNSDSSRSETADAFNNVVGKYSFVAADGQNREIRYRAGSATGYVAEGDSIPEVAVVSAPAAEAAVPTLYNVPARAAPEVLYSAPTPVIPVPSPVAFQPETQPRGDASYSFQYSTDDSDRQESADSDLNVKGSYSFIADDGLRRNVNYIAGSATGFVAQGDHLPVAPEPAAPAAPIQYSAPSAPAPVAPAAQVYSAPSEPRGDASYHFSYQNSDSSRSESSDSDLNVRGDYSFIADDGQLRTVNYIAGSATGFVAQGDHLPVAPEPIAVEPQTSPVQLYRAPQPSSIPAATTYTSASTEPRRDASYNFKYENQDSSRSETADSDLNIEGEYSFVGADGQTRRVTYRAGSGTGFVAEGDHLPVNVPISPAFTSASIYSAPASSAQSGHSVQSHFVGGSTPSFKSHQAEDANIISNQGADGSYSFSYSNSDSSRSESADSSNNVVGEYSFTADDGQTRQIRYRAGSGTGFIAEGDSIPVAPEIPAVPQVYAPAPIAPAPVTLYSAPPVPTFSGSVTSFEPRGDASYSFSYTNEDSSRSESADSDLNVEGSYSFVADDGVERKVNYIAGSATGFIAQGDHLPVAPEVPSVRSPTTYSQTSTHVSVKSAPTAPVISHEAASIRSNLERGGGYSFSYTNSDSSRSETADASNNVVGHYSFIADDGQNRRINYIAGSATGYVAEGDSIPVANVIPETVHTSATVYSAPAPVIPVVPVHSAVVSQQSVKPRGDASYSFSYNNEDSAREESADSDLNVQGSYSFVADDGIQRSVNYIAGSATGFVAVGDHLPVAPEVSGVVLPQLAAPVQPTVYSGSRSPDSAFSSTSSTGRNDASYSFNYVADGSSRDETADGDLNVKGRYTFVADDGVERTVNYIAGSGTGFVAEGTHLPVQGSSSSAWLRSPGTTTFSSGSTSSASTVRSSSGSSASTRGVTSYTFPGPTNPLHVPSPPIRQASGGTIVGNVLLNQYEVGPGRSKFGYAYTEI